MPAKTGHGPDSSYFFVLFYVFFCVVLCDVCFVTFPVLFVCIYVLNNCHRVATQLQLNIYIYIYHIISFSGSVCIKQLLAYCFAYRVDCNWCVSAGKSLKKIVHDT
jgi:hypothetical protein